MYSTAHAQLVKHSLPNTPCLPITMKAQPQARSVIGKKVVTVGLPVARVCGGPLKVLQNDVLVS